MTTLTGHLLGQGKIKHHFQPGHIRLEEDLPEGTCHGWATNHTFCR